MEGLTLEDGQAYVRDADCYRSKDRRHRSSRLPTPEDSQSSNETFDGRSPSETGHPIRDLLLRPAPQDRHAATFGTKGVHRSRRDSRNMGAPCSPPYRSPQTQKPSLPPLKTVLGNSISSPPRTPSPHDPAMPLSAREPSYTALTYKPPSLYPNKKQRTEPFSAPPFSASSNGRAAFAPSLTLEPRLNGTSARPHVQFPSFSGAPDGIHSRRPSTDPSPTWTSQQHIRAYPRSATDAPASHYQTPEQTPTTSTPDSSFPRSHDPFAREMRGSFAQADDRMSSRRPSLNGYPAFPPRPSEHEPMQAFARDARYHGAAREGLHAPRDHARFSRGENGYGQAHYPGQGPAFFMPSHYEFQHNKARKRSNLPKRSTEIMKTWFDQNITNPYPSEEQKAMFSNATGISMTQVSNWFINHRRRCPELRDKRERGRGQCEA